MTNKELKENIELLCNEYVKRFSEKQEVYFDYWVAEIIGETAVLGDYCFNFSDIKLDIDTDQPKGLIFNWYNDNIENEGKSINYFSYTLGLRHDFE